MSALPRASQILLVGQRIRQLRKSRHLTQADLASRIGITQSDLSRMESGEYKVGLDTLFKILQVFELSMSRFFEEAPAPERSGPDPEVAEAAEKEQLFRDLADLSDDSRREVREFIAFKKMQANSRRSPNPQWRPEVARPVSPDEAAVIVAVPKAVNGGDPVAESNESIGTADETEDHEGPKVS